MAKVSEQRDLQQAIDKLMLKRFGGAEQSLIRRAAGFAADRHGQQRRASGEPFVMHPLSVALILADENLSAQTVVAGILHDVVEDTDTTISEVEENFGAEVGVIVDGVTKITRLSPHRSAQKHKTETYRKLLLAAVTDARVLVVKLADRLHNLRTIGSLPYSKRQRIAQETLEIYAPLAHRLGMSAMRAELDDRSLAIVDPSAYEQAGMIQAEAVRKSQVGIDAIGRRLRVAIESEGMMVNTIKARVKSKASIAEKLARGGGRREIEDVVGLRVIVEEVDECYRALGVIHSMFPPKPGAFDDYIAVPRANLYKSLHTTVNAEGQLVEIQIRTTDMDQVAEHGIAAHWAYKDATLQGGGPRSTQRFLARAAENQNEAAELDEAFAALKSDFFSEEIYVFTPRGEVKVLPAGSCAIDFAYAIHSEIGNRISGARADGRLTSITKPLKPGQVVEIMTGSTDHPSLDWLPYVKTARARQRIRSFHNAHLESERTDKGVALLRAELERHHAEQLADHQSLEQGLADLGYDLATAASEALRDRHRLRDIARRLIANGQQEREEGESSSEESAEKGQVRGHEGPRLTSSIVVDGMSDVATRLAGCCSPEPTDEIIGYISHGYGVTVHRVSCSNAQQLRETQEPRMIEVQWKGERQESFRATLSLRFLDRPRLLEDLAEAVYEVGAELVDLNLHAALGIVSGNAVFEVTDPEHSEELRQSLAAMKGALHVSRGN